MTTRRRYANEHRLDIYADVSIRLAGSRATPGAGSYFGLYLCRMLADGSTYGMAF